MKTIHKTPADLGSFPDLPRQQLVTGTTPLEPLPNLTRACGGANLFVKRDDCTGLAFGGNKIRQLEFYMGEAVALGADTILITGAVQSNFVRSAAAAACKLGMLCHIQHEERVAATTPQYRQSGNVLLGQLLGATLYSYPTGEDESGADKQLGRLADDLRADGRVPYIIPLAPGHPPLGALGYVVAAHECLQQLDAANLHIDQIFVGSGSGATHSGLLYGLRALGSDISVMGVCVRRDAELQRARIAASCEGIAALLESDNVVADEDIELTDEFLAPGYGIPSEAVLDAVLAGARSEGLIIDPVYTGKALAATLAHACSAAKTRNVLFWHTGGTPAVFAYQDVIEKALARRHSK